MTVKQKILQSAYAFRSIPALCIVLCGSCIAASLATAQSLSGGPGETAATMRLIAAPGLAPQGYEAGVEITMSAGSHTYWKMPGESGVPPVFAFNGSENTAAATVLFPAPHRITEDGLDAIGYTDNVIFPVRVTPTDPSKPSVLHADVTYAVCNKICLPAHGEAILTLVPKASAEDGSTGLVETAFSQVPKIATNEQQAMLSVTRVAISGHDAGSPSGAKPESKPTWTLTWRGADAVEDIFAEAPEGYFFTTKKTGDTTWSLVADQSVGLVSAKAIPISLTLKERAGGLVIMEKLDVGAPIQ